MYTNKEYYLEFELQKIKEVDVLNEFTKMMDEKLERANIKYDIIIVPGNKKMVGGVSSFPYNKFENVMDSIVVGKKQYLKQERKGLFNQLFKKPDENKDKIDKKKSYLNFEIFNTKTEFKVDDIQIGKKKNIEMVSQEKDNKKDYTHEDIKDSIEYDDEEKKILNVILIIYRDNENDKILSTVLSIQKTLLVN